MRACPGKSYGDVASLRALASIGHVNRRWRQRVHKRIADDDDGQRGAMNVAAIARASSATVIEPRRRKRRATWLQI